MVLLGARPRSQSPASISTHTHGARPHFELNPSGRWCLFVYFHLGNVHGKYSLCHQVVRLSENARGVDGMVRGFDERQLLSLSLSSRDNDTFFTELCRQVKGGNGVKPYSWVPAHSRYKIPAFTDEPVILIALLCSETKE